MNTPARNEVPVAHTDGVLAAKLATDFRKIIAHTAVRLGADNELLLGLLASCDRIAREALAEYDTAKDSPAGEPVAWMVNRYNPNDNDFVCFEQSTAEAEAMEDDEVLPLYTQPPQSAPEARDK